MRSQIYQCGPGSHDDFFYDPGPEGVERKKEEETDSESVHAKTDVDSDGALVPDNQLGLESSVESKATRRMAPRPIYRCSKACCLKV